MNILQQLSAFMDVCKEDARITPLHISLYSALLYGWQANDCLSPICINRQEVMRLSKISGRGTYNKHMQELHAYGYIRYVPSYHPILGSLVYLHGFPECVGIIQLAKTGGKQ